MYYVRWFLLTIVLAWATLLSGAWTSTFVVLLVLALPLDLFVTRQSPELTWLQDEQCLQSPRKFDRHWTLGLQASATLLSASIPFLGHAAPPPDDHVLWKVLGIVLGGMAGTFFGFRNFTNNRADRTELATELDTLPAALGALELLGGRRSRLAAAVVRGLLGTAFVTPFLLVVEKIETTPVALGTFFIVLVLAIFFQLGMALLSQALFLVHRRDAEVQTH